MTIQRATTPHGIEIAYETFGDASHPPVLLVMGLGTQMLGWPEGFCQELARRGHFVVRFDNRDVGLSTHLHDTPRADPVAAWAGDLEGNVAVVTGGGAGIGRAISLRLAEEGARVAVLDIRQETADQTLLLAGGDGVALTCDVSDSAAVDATFARIESELGPPDILVNNAGAIGMDHLRRVKPLIAKQRAEAADGGVTTPLDALVRLSDEEWRRMLAIHLDGTFYCTRAAVRSMAPRGRGAIVNMSSVCGLEGCTGHPHYSAAKAAVLGFTKAAGKELIVQGVRVNCVAPGHVGTATLQGEINEERSAIAASTPAGRLAHPDEVAATVAFLASDDAGYYVGAVLSPNGGLVTA